MTISQYGSATDYQFLLEIPGVTDPDRVKSIIQATAILEFKLVDAGPFQSEAVAFQNYNGFIPQQFELVQDAGNRFYTVQRIAAVSGSDLRDAFRSHDENGRPAGRDLEFWLQAEREFREAEALAKTAGDE